MYKPKNSWYIFASSEQQIVNSDWCRKKMQSSEICEDSPNQETLDQQMNKKLQHIEWMNNGSISVHIYIHYTFSIHCTESIQTERYKHTFIHTYIQLYTYASAAQVNSRTEHAEMHNGGRHKIDGYNSIKPFKKKEDRQEFNNNKPLLIAKHSSED